MRDMAFFDLLGGLEGLHSVSDGAANGFLYKLLKDPSLKMED